MCRPALQSLRHRAFCAPAARRWIRAVILIAALALARKIIVTDLFQAAPASTLALAALMLALGAAYWLMREREGATPP